MISDQRLIRLAAIGALVAALGLSACGRKGSLDPPPGAAAPAQTSETAPELMPGPPPATQQPAGYIGVGSDGKPAAPPPTSGRQQPFFLDWLLN